MKKYNIFVNGVRQGSVTTDDVASFLNKNYESIKYKIDENENDVFLQMDTLEIMRRTMNK